MKTKVKHHRVDATNGLDYTRTIPEFEAYFASIGKEVKLPSPFDETVTVGMGRYYDLKIVIPATDLPDDSDPNDPKTEVDPAKLFDDETKTEKTPTAISVDTIELVVPTDVQRKIIKKLTGETLPRMPGEFKAGSAPQNVSKSACLGYYLDGGLCAQWKEVVTSA